MKHYLIFAKPSMRQKVVEFTAAVAAVDSSSQALKAQSVGELVSMLAQPRDWSLCAVLMTANREELKDLVALQNLLVDLRVILAVPNLETETVNLGHLLRPRLITSFNTDLSGAAQVLVRMLTTKDHVLA